MALSRLFWRSLILLVLPWIGLSFPAIADSKTSSVEKWWIKPQKAASTVSSRRLNGIANNEKIVSYYGYQFSQQSSLHYRLMYRDPQQSLQAIAETCELLERAHRRFYEDYTKAGFSLRSTNEPLLWVVFDHRPAYRDFAQRVDGMDSPSLESYYSSSTNQVVLMQIAHHRFDDGRIEDGGFVNSSANKNVNGGVNDGGMVDVRRAVHEAAHQLAFNSGLLKRGVMYPLWAVEGLATNFEADAASNLGVGLENVPRIRQLLRARQAVRMVSLERFVAMVQIPNDGPECANDTYAQAWAFYNFLYKTRRTQLRHYLEQLATLEPGTRDSRTMYNEFVSAFGPVSSLQQPWSRFLDELQRVNSSVP